MIWHCGKYEFDTSTPIIMGVLNVTPDSFSDGGDFIEIDDALSHAREMIAAGASIIDVGGESTRPGADPVDPDQEWSRIADIIDALAQEGTCVSVDTRHASVAKRAVDSGASIINDVSGFRCAEMVDVAASCNAGLVIMHMKGDPKTMQDAPEYDDVVAEVKDYLELQARMLENAGVASDRICIDPGPGFGKTPSQTIELMRNIHELAHLGYPVMVAVSRKSFIAKAYKIDDDDPKARDAASAQEALMACELGASVIRTHNVAATVEALKSLRPYVFLGLGSNVALVADDGEENEGKIAQINMAIGHLCQLPDTQIIDIAPFYGSKPAYYEEQDDFVNTVVMLRTGIPPKELLDYLHVIENTLGRKREVVNGPRTLDIDILDYQLYDFSTDELTVPHPRITERDFVVKPFMDIAANHVLANGIRVDSVAEEERIGHAWKL
ncbi:MAG: dihydropteroate synthase [Eggerthellaceae bacterium]|nr:dihydropteroate synthase [Eggerthellaceae bacterium]